MSNDCKKRLTCATCNKNHPTCLHEERYPKKPEENKRSEEQDSTNIRKTTSCTLQDASSASTSTIVPVWLSSLLKPEKEVLVYAILFILKETCFELDAETQPMKLRLSTITSQDSLVDSQSLKPSSKRI